MRPEIVMDTGGKPVFVQYVERRIRRNKNFLMVITGPTGSGKTYSALRLGEGLDRDFSIENVCFYPDEFMSLLNEDKKPLPSGSVIVYEEAGVTLGHRDWQSVQNRLIHYVMQTFRHRNLIVIFTVPDFGFFDLAARKLVHCRAETVGIDEKAQEVVLKPFFLSFNQSTGKQYNMFLRYSGGSQVGGGSVQKLERLRVGLPSKTLLEAYEGKKRAFTDRLNSEIMSKLKPKDDDEARADPVPEAEREVVRANLADRQRDLLDLLEQGKTVGELLEGMGYNSMNTLYRKRQELLNRGFVIKKEGTGLDARYSVLYPTFAVFRHSRRKGMMKVKKSGVRSDAEEREG